MTTSVHGKFTQVSKVPYSSNEMQFISDAFPGTKLDGDTVLLFTTSTRVPGYLIRSRQNPVKFLSFFMLVVVQQSKANCNDYQGRYFSSIMSWEWDRFLTSDSILTSREESAKCSWPCTSKKGINYSIKWLWKMNGIIAKKSQDYSCMYGSWHGCG